MILFLSTMGTALPPPGIQTIAPDLLFGAYHPQRQRHRTLPPSEEKSACGLVGVGLSVQKPPSFFWRRREILAAMSDKPKPLKVFGRSHYACTRCKLSKIKCLGEKPACANCKAVNKEQQCVYPLRDRKIVIMESDLNKLHEKVRMLEDLVKCQALYSDQQNLLFELSLVQKRTSKGLAAVPELYLLPDAENDRVPLKLLLLCRHQLPDQHYTWQLLNAVLLTYSREFYIIDLEALHPLVNRIYLFFLVPDLETVPIQDHIPLLSLSYFFGLLAFGEQMKNMTLELLPPSILAATGEPHKFPGIEYYSTAARLFSLAHEDMLVQFIQNALVLGLYVCNLNRYNTVNNYFGVAVRSAVANGFHRKMATPRLLSDEQRREHLIFEEKTKRLWWSIFVIDVVWAAKMNMPAYIDYTDTDVALPNDSPILDLNDNFNTEILEANVHLAKFIAKYNRLIYGPSIRTFTMNYINTEQFNQKILIKNIIHSLNDLQTLFETPTLSDYKHVNIISLPDRNVANLFLRYNQMTILIAKPLLSLILNKGNRSLINEPAKVMDSIATIAASSARSVETLLKLYEYNKLFVLGFWDSQHLLSAVLLLVMASVAGVYYENLNKATALLKYMAENQNINAINAMEKLVQVNGFLSRIPEISLRLDLELDITRFVNKKSPSINDQPNGHTVPFFNPFSELALDTNYLRNIRSPDIPLYEQFGFHKMSQPSQEAFYDMITTLQSWDNFRGLPIHVYGTGVTSEQEPHQQNQSQATSNFKIGNIIQG